jgi:hypothetical protein
VPLAAAESAVAPAAPALAETDCAALASTPAESAAEIAVLASSVGKVATASQPPSASVSNSTAALVEASVVEKVPPALAIVSVLPDVSSSLILTTSRW